MPNTVVVVAEDDQVFKNLQAPKYTNKITVERSNLVSHSEAVNYGTKDYRKIVSSRAEHILRHLHAGQDILYSDIDTVWRSDPTPYIEGASDKADIIAQVDSMNNPHYTPYFCTGFMGVYSNARSIDLMERWNKELMKSPQMNQPIFNKLLHTKGLHSVEFSALSLDLFPPGIKYFGPATAGQATKFKVLTREDKKNVVVVHNNFIMGKDKKKLRFEAAGLWKVH